MLLVYGSANMARCDHCGKMPICSVCGKEIKENYVARDLNNNCYCSTKCFADKWIKERIGKVGKSCK